MLVNYNIGTRYIIVGRITHGTSVSEYVLKDTVLRTLVKMEKCLVEQLALNKQIYNCNAQIYNNIINLKGINCKLSKLPRYDDNINIVTDTKEKHKITADLRLVGKVTSGRIISDYIVVDINKPDNLIKIPKNTVLKLAREGRIVNAKSQVNGTEMMLRGTSNDNLSNLKTYCY